MQQQRPARIILIAIIALAATYLTFSVKNAVASANTSETFQPVRAVLERIPSGESALALMDQYQVGLKFQSGKGTYYLASSNTIVIDNGAGAMRAALSFVHEINHAKYWHQGLRADINSLPQEEYARLRVEEEAEGVVKSIEAKMEFQRAGLDVSELSYPLEAVYREAAQRARNAATIQDWGISEAELAQIGRAAGTAAVFEGFMDGKVWTSHTLEPYTDFYGQCWDKAETARDLLGSFSDLVAGATGYDLLSTVTGAISDSC